MGLSSRQVCSAELDWNQTLLQDQNYLDQLPKSPTPIMRKQQQQQQITQQQSSEPVNCPRCDSTNTKFCYYNNYNKSQPRHFCRACKRHWTKGGTLRNVPVGGGRKNKRVKKLPITTPTTTTITTTTSATTSNQRQSLVPPFAMNHDQKNTPQLDLMSTKDFVVGNEIFLSSTMSFPQNQSMLFPFSTSNSFDTNPCSVSTSSLRPSNVGYSYGEEFKSMEEHNTQTWEEIPPATSTGMEMSNYWSWEDIDSLVSTDLNVPWDDDSDIKP